jgi:hypothetical protein
MQTQETNTQTALLSKCVKTSHNTLTSLWPLLKIQNCVWWLLC